MRTRPLSRLAPAVLLAFGAAAFARAGEATDQIRQTTDKILAVVQDAALKGAQEQAQRREAIRRIADERFDWEAMSRSAMGPPWRNLTAPQRKTFTDAFSQLIEQTYMTKVENYAGEKILYKGDKTDGNYGVVEIVIVTTKGTEIPVSYRVLKKGPQWLVYDVSVEGVSLVNNYRSQIASILNHSPFDELIQKIKARTADADVKPDAEPGAAPEASR